MKENTVLLLTATISPSGYNLFTSEERMAQYRQALEYYLQADIAVSGIVFVENSGVSLESLKGLDSNSPRKVEMISLNVTYPDSLKLAHRKSYGEMKCIDAAMSESKLIRQATYVAKMTGRLILSNLNGLLNSVDFPVDLMCDIKDQGWAIRRLMGNKTAAPHCDVRFLLFSKDLYGRKLKNIGSEIIEKKFILETSIYRIVKEPEMSSKIIFRFPIEPFFIGKSGSFKSYRYENGILWSIRNYIRIYMPCLHL